MPTIDPQASMKLQSELMPGERIFWAGMPNPSVIFHSSDWTMIPFSLLWGGFAVFWEGGAAGSWGNRRGSAHSWEVGMIFGAAFVVIGQYLIWGRFVVDAWLKRRTYYAVTDRRILFLQDGFKRKVRGVYLDSVTETQREGSPTGILWLGPKASMVNGRNRSNPSWSFLNIDATVPVLADIDDVDSVYRLILDLRQKRTEARANSQPTDS
jgi:hypothetical protein